MLHTLTEPRPRTGRRTAVLAVLAAGALAATQLVASPPAGALPDQNVVVAEGLSDPEDAGSATVTFEITNPDEPPGEDVHITWETADGTAKAGEDYEAVAGGTTTINAADTAADDEVTLLQDLHIEDDETFTVIITDVSTETGTDTVDGEDNEGTVTITNDDPKVFIAEDDAEPEVVEGGDTTVTVSMTDPLTEDVVVSYSASNTGAEDDDYTLPDPTEVTIPAGQTSADVAVSTTEDNEGENNETFELTLDPIDSGAAFIDADRDTATITIQDDDILPVIVIDDAKVAEGATDATSEMVFTVRLTDPETGEPRVAPGNVTVTYSTEEDTANDSPKDDELPTPDEDESEAQDYEPASGEELFIPHGDTQGTIAVTVLGDGEKEWDEHFKLDLTDCTGARFDPDDNTVCSGSASAWGRIVNDDGTNDLPVLSVSEATAEEGTDSDGTVTFTVEFADGGTTVEDQRVRFDYTTRDHTAFDGRGDDPDEDYTPASGTATIGPAGEDEEENPGEGSTQVTVDLVADSKAEYYETFDLVITSPVNAELDDPDGDDEQIAPGGIVNDDDDPVIPLLKIADASRDEGAPDETPDMEFTASLHHPDTGDPMTIPADVMVDYNTATDDEDENPAVEGSSDPDDQDPQEDDFVAVDSATVAIPAGEPSVQIPVTLLGDAVHEADETFLLEASQPDARTRNSTFGTDDDGDEQAQVTRTGTILNDDPLPSINVPDLMKPEGNVFDNAFEITIRLSNPSDQKIAVEWATQDGTATKSDDYEPTGSSSRPLEFRALEEEQTVEVAVHGDDVDEPDEHFLIDLFNPSASAQLGDEPGEVTILDDDGPKVEVHDTSVVEGSSGTTQAAFEVTLSRTTEQDVRVEYETADDTATDGLDEDGEESFFEDEDYEPTSDTLVIPAGQTSGEAVVDVVADTRDEDDEQFLVRLTEVREAVMTDDGREAAGEILDDDDPPDPNESPQAVVKGPSTGVEGEELSFDGSGSSDPDGSITEHAWVFGDNTGSGRGETVTHAFRDDGTFTVSLRVTDDEFATDIADHEVEIANAPPVADAGGDRDVDVDQDVLFSAAESHDPGTDDTLSFEWAFGDGSGTKTGEEVTHRYTELGERTVTLTVTDDEGASDTTTFTANVVPDTAEVQRAAGAGRVETAVEASRQNWDKGGSTQVVLATARGFADGLAGGSLTAALQAPLLLTEPDELPDAVLGELERLGAERVWLLGGPVAISRSVQDALEEAGLATERIQGGDRFETAAVLSLLLESAIGVDEVMIALGDHPDPNKAWADALSAGAIAARNGPTLTLLTRPNDLPDATAGALSQLDPSQVTILGGPAAISGRVDQQLRELGFDPNRLWGETRYETSVAVAEEALKRLPGDGGVPLALSTGANYPDGLAAAGVAAQRDGLVLLVPPDTLERTPATRDFLAAHARRFDDGVLLGGTAAVGDAVADAVRDAILSQ